jgi:uncharacterized membrane protein
MQKTTKIKYFLILSLIYSINMSTEADNISISENNTKNNTKNNNFKNTILKENNNLQSNIIIALYIIAVILFLIALPLLSSLGILVNSLYIKKQIIKNDKTITIHTS